MAHGLLGDVITSKTTFESDLPQQEPGMGTKRNLAVVAKLKGLTERPGDLASPGSQIRLWTWPLLSTSTQTVERQCTNRGATVSEATLQGGRDAHENAAPVGGPSPGAM